MMWEDDQVLDLQGGPKDTLTVEIDAAVYSMLTSDHL
jgi:hypothetical protein